MQSFFYFLFFKSFDSLEIAVLKGLSYSDSPFFLQKTITICFFCFSSAFYSPPVTDFEPGMLYLTDSETIPIPLHRKFLRFFPQLRGKFIQMI